MSYRKEELTSRMLKRGIAYFGLFAIVFSIFFFAKGNSLESNSDVFGALIALALAMGIFIVIAGRFWEKLYGKEERQRFNREPQ